MFFDSCHSGGNQRALTLDVPTEKGAKARLVRLTPRTVAAYRKKRGANRRRSAGDRERGVFFAACRPDEVAWESDGHGDFTRVAAPLLEALSGSTNQQFLEQVLAAFGADRKQTPVLLPPHLTTRRLLGAEQPQRALPDLPGTLPGTVTPRDRAIAKVLRSVADLVES
jgi:hypothetical protein